MANDQHETPTHVVGVFTEAAANGPVHEPDPDIEGMTVDRVGGEAFRRAAYGAIIAALVGAVAAAGIAAVAGYGRSTALAAALGAAALFGAIGGLWGAFMRLGRADDWREAMPATPEQPDVIAPSGETQSEVPMSAQPLVDRGAVEVQVEEDDAEHRS